MPHYRAEAILKRRDALYEAFVCVAGGRPVTPDVMDDLVSSAHRLLGPRVAASVIRDSLRVLSGVTATETLLRETAHRLAGNLPRLESGRPVLPWSGQAAPEWVLAAIAEVRRTRHPRTREPAIEVIWKILAGSPCPLTVRQVWSWKKVHYLAPYFGFDRVRGRRSLPRFAFVAPEQLTTLRAYALVDPQRSSPERGPVLGPIAVTASLRRFNRTQFRYRERAGPPPYVCPFGFPLDLPCHECYVGYDRCRAACHPVTYILSRCVVCAQDTLHDPRDNVCLVCRSR